MSFENKNYLKVESKFKYIVFLCIYFLAYPIAKILYGRKKNWLVCERGNDAQDNGYVFFKYLCEKHKEINATYLIAKNSPEYKKVSKIGKTAEFCSFKHFLMVIGCPVKISSQLFGYAPWITMALYFRRNKTRDIHVFLQHGVIKNDHKSLYGDVCKSLDMFVCGAKPEYDFINSNFHYTNEAPQYTGLARYDLLKELETKKQIIIMPTWRADLSTVDDKTFLNSDFYSAWNNLITNQTLINICKEKNVTVKFYLHYSLQQFSHLFDNEFVQIVKFGEETVQNLLKESALLITDFSSVYFDFGYMNKPVIYYQFDEDTFYDEHYEKGYFDYRRDGFGDVCLNITSLLSSIQDVVNNDFVINPRYEARINKFFIYRDTHNCDRIYSRIDNLVSNKH